MQSALLPFAPSESSFQDTILPAKYDQQLGLTFVENFVSLAYNVTAVDQTDAYGYGPAYLLNGLSNTGYWYQVGLSYNWPFSGISGYSQGFAFNYQVFAPNRTAVYPLSGGGGLQPFSGPVNPGDSVLLVLSFQYDFVVMFAQDWNTSAVAFQVFSAEGAQFFEGSPYGPANQNGFFTGLMTEWYHPTPYFSNYCKVTYSNDHFALLAAWMWMDEYDPYNYSWTGAWFSQTVGPVDFSQNPTQTNTFSFRDLTESCSSSEFSTGLIVPLSTSITLTPGILVAPLSDSNCFEVWYTLNGRQMSTIAQSGTLTVTADSNTKVVVSGISSGSSLTECWVLNAGASNVTVSAGTSATFVYYDLLLQIVGYTVSGGGDPPDFAVTYYSAPETASSQIALRRMDVSIPSASYCTIMAARGSTAIVPDSISNHYQERWLIEGSSNWTITSAYQIPARIVYQRQFLLSFAGSQLNWKWVNADTTTEVTLPGVSDRSTGSGLRVTSFNIDNSAATLVRATTGTVTFPVFMNSPHVVSINMTKQFQLNLTIPTANLAYVTPPTIADDNYWYDQGTAVKLVLKSLTERASGIGLRLESVIVNGVITNSADVNPDIVLEQNAISSAETVNVRTIRQHQIYITSGSLASITGPPAPGDAGWYDEGSLVTMVFNHSWNHAMDQSRENAISYTINDNEITLLNRFGEGTFPVQIAVTSPVNVSVQSIVQYKFSFAGGFNVITSNESPTNDSFFDERTYLALTTDSTGKVVNEGAKRKITGYFLDGKEIDFDETESAELTTSQIYFDKSHELAFKSIDTKVPSGFTIAILCTSLSLTLVAVIVAVVAVVTILMLTRRK